MDTRHEVLVVRGYLDRAGRFTLRRSRSTAYVRQWPVVEKSDVVIELLDGEGRVLHREAVEVTPETTCDPGATRRLRVTAYIELREEAVALRLRRDDIDLWHARIPDAPTVRVSLRSKRPGRDRRIHLGLRFKPLGEGAHLTVVYKWGPRRFRPVYVGPPAETVDLNLRDLPGGDECQVVVSFSNGLRSAQAATPFFKVPRLGPSVAIVRPSRKDTIIAGTPLVLEGSVRDDERPGGPREDDIVWLVDGEEVGRGMITSIDSVRAGRRRVVLEYRSEPPARSTVVVSARSLGKPSANEWSAWDHVTGNN